MDAPWKLPIWVKVNFAVSAAAALFTAANIIFGLSDVVAALCVPVVVFTTIMAIRGVRRARRRYEAMLR